MRRLLLLLFISLFIGSAAVAQNGQQYEEPSQPETDRSHFERIHWKKPKKSAITIWSQDFANGIPSNWVNEGFDHGRSHRRLNPKSACVYGSIVDPTQLPTTLRAHAASMQDRVQLLPHLPTRIQWIPHLSIQITWILTVLSGNRGGNGVSPTPHVGTLIYGHHRS